MKKHLTRLGLDKSHESAILELRQCGIYDIEV